MENLQDLPDVKQGKTPDAVRMLLGGPISENLAKARLASPVDHVTPDDPPFLIVHGEKDPIVPVKQARILADALEKAGVEVTLQVLPDAGHGVLNSETAKLAAEFFDKHLKKDKKLQTGYETQLMNHIAMMVSIATLVRASKLGSHGIISATSVPL